jgi:hypothetical protein
MVMPLTRLKAYYLLGAASILYSTIPEDSDKKFAIQGKG